MSGQPYRYFTDPTKFRTEYMDTLGLREDLDQMNYEANLTYKQTGQLPAVSQMKDTRSTTDILLDYEKLKMDIIKTVSTISNMQFGQMVVQSIIDNPLNTDNKFLVFSAQRIVDIVNSVKKLYRYGVKGDSNDAEQFVDFITVMYNDKNQLTAQTKSFMNRQGVKSLTLATSVFSTLYDYLTKLGANLLQINNTIQRDYEVIYSLPDIEGLKQFTTIMSSTVSSLGAIVSFITALKGAIPRNANEATQIENLLFEGARQKEFTVKPYPIKEYGGETPKDEEGDSGRKYYKTGQILPRDTNYPGSFISNYQSDIDGFLYRYLDFLNTALPAVGILISIDRQLFTFWNQAKKTFSNIFTDEKKYESIFEFESRELTKLMVESGWIKACIINYTKVNDLLDNLINALQPAPEWDEQNIIFLTKQKKQYNIHDLAKRKMSQYDRFGDIGSDSSTSSQSTNLSPASSQFVNPNPSSLGSDSDSDSMYSAISRPSPPTRESVMRSAEDYSRANDRREDEAEIDDLLNQMKSADPNDSKTIKALYIRRNQLIGLYNDSYPQQYVPPESRGSGIIRRRGRPRGCGIAKPISYKESVKAHAVLDKGIMETPRFVKFGKYLVNNHKLHNEDIFALKRMAGGNIVDIPSIKISKNLGGVIKKMLGGAIPTYSDISKLSEPEKAYLHKVSQKSNILDKFDIPAPSKDNQDKDVHQFEVMRGEIMAGNDSKELIKKFKIHILKLSRNGTLPKREVQEILEELLELGN